MTGRLSLLVVIAACYSPTAQPGAPCNPTTANCPEGQSCLPVAGGYECVASPLVADASRDTPISDAPRDGRPGIDAAIDAAGTPWTLVQTASSEGMPSLALQAPTGGGHLIIVAVQSPSMVAAVADDGANLYSQVPNTTATANGGGLGISLWTAKSTIGTKNIMVAGNSVAAIVAWEVAGLRATNPLDTSAALSDQAATTLPVGAPVTTTQAGDFIVSVAMVANQITGVHQGVPFTEDSTAKANGWAHFTSTAAPAGLHQAKWDQPMAGVYCSASAAFFVGP